MRRFGAARTASFENERCPALPRGLEALAREEESAMNYQSDEKQNPLAPLFGAFETLWETLIVLGVAAGVCFSVTAMSAHLNQAKVLRLTSDGPVAVQSTAIPSTETVSRAGQT
jgi:hypothetical protein